MSPSCPCCKLSLKEAIYAISGYRLYKTCPRCSQHEQLHQFYECPDGFTATPKRSTKSASTGVQSYCSCCRPERKGIYGSGKMACSVPGTLHVIRSARILPMSDAQLAGVSSLYSFFTQTIPSRQGKYYFLNRHIKDAEDCLFLFQYKASIIGHALCVRETLFPHPDSHNYIGYYELLPETIMMYDSPFSLEEFKKVDGTIKSFSQASHAVALSTLHILFSLLESRQKDLCKKILADIKNGENLLTAVEGGEQPELYMPEAKEGEVRERWSSRYERNRAARQACLQYYSRLHNGRICCEICGFDFESKYGESFRDFIHVHHLHPLASFNGEHQIDPIKDLIPICPNCHAVAHKKPDPYTPDEIRAMLNPALSKRSPCQE